ncbi:hypothetical protein H9P43_007283 [Blastocladiella emersonii ATCC 22665]|nr:hypothetical protein H9P43_007283 [Blastocladiella emersonii ATCC 22665]
MQYPPTPLLSPEFTPKKERPSKIKATHSRPAKKRISKLVLPPGSLDEHLEDVAAAIQPTPRQERLAHECTDLVADYVLRSLQAALPKLEATRAARVGSLHKKTAIHFSFDVDRVFMMSNFNPTTRHLEDTLVVIERALALAADPPRYWPVDDGLVMWVADVKRRANSIACTVYAGPLNLEFDESDGGVRHAGAAVPAFKVKLDLLCATEVVADPDHRMTRRGTAAQVESLRHVLSTNETVSKSLHRLYQPLVSEATVETVLREPDVVRKLIRILKLWGMLVFSSSATAMSKSTIFENLAVYAVREYAYDRRELTLEALAIKVIRYIANLDKLQLGGTRKDRPAAAYVLHMCDESNNLTRTDDSRVFSVEYQGDLKHAAESLLPDTPAAFWLMAYPQDKRLITTTLMFLRIRVLDATCATTPMPGFWHLDKRFEEIGMHHQIAALVTVALTLQDWIRGALCAAVGDTAKAVIQGMEQYLDSEYTLDCTPGSPYSTDDGRTALRSVAETTVQLLQRLVGFTKRAEAYDDTTQFDGFAVVIPVVPDVVSLHVEVRCPVVDTHKNLKEVAEDAIEEENRRERIEARRNGV